MRSNDYPLALLALFFMGSIFALPSDLAEKEVPGSVLERFKATYPNAKNVRYREDDAPPPKRVYEVSFDLDDERQATHYFYDGLGVVEDRED